MNVFLSTQPDIAPFQTFSLLHIITVIAIIAINTSVLIFFKRNHTESSTRIFRYTVAVMLILFEAGEQVWLISTGGWSPESSLPLNLCRISTFITAAMLINKNYLLYEIADLGSGRICKCHTHADDQQIQLSSLPFF